MLVRRLCSLALGICALVFANVVSASANAVIGGFDATRGGQASFTVGSFFDSARLACFTNFEGISFTSSTSLTAEFLDEVDVLVVSAIISDGTRVTPLSTLERDALAAFVNNGGALLALLDNQSFSGTWIEETFGLLTTGMIGGSTQSTITNTGSVIASGPFGTVATFSQAWPGYFNAVPPAGSTVAVNGLGPSVVTFNRGALVPGSGPCAFYSDNQTFIDDGAIPGADYSNNATLFLNTIAFLVPPKAPNASATATWGAIKATYR